MQRDIIKKTFLVTSHFSYKRFGLILTNNQAHMLQLMLDSIYITSKIRINRVSF